MQLMKNFEMNLIWQKHKRNDNKMYFGINIARDKNFVMKKPVYFIISIGYIYYYIGVESELLTAYRSGSFLVNIRDRTSLPRLNGKSLP